MTSPEVLKKQLEELILYQVENDILEFPHSKHEFAPYVVSSLLRGITHDQVAVDVLRQLDEAIEREKQMVQVVPKATFKDRIIEWLRKF